jgi:YtxH-like protein
MRFRRREPLFSVLLGTGLHLLDSLRQRLPEAMDDVKDRVGDKYEIASDRVSRASAALRGEEESQLLGKGIALLIGVGIGVGIGLLIAPVSGEETREEITEKVSEFKDKVRERTGKKQQGVGITGTDRE